MGAMDMRVGRKGKQECQSPFLARAGLLRTGEREIPGYYCELQRMWVVETKRGPQPIIDEWVLPQLLTKTRVSDEEDNDTYLALELMTKTLQQLEGDDDRAYGPSGLLQLLTKTETIREADDNFEANHLLELVTKTRTQRETDDDGFQSLGLGN